MVRPSAPRRAIAISPPSLPIALGVTAAAMAVLVGGQIVFRGATHEGQKGALAQSIDMTGADSANGDTASGDAETHTANRIPAEESGNVAEADAANVASDGNGDATAGASTSEPSETSSGDPSKKSAAVLASTNTNTASDSAGDVPLTPERKVKLLNGKLTLDLYKQPLIGSPKAPHVVAEIISYNCPHCRKAHRQMKQALARYGDQVALVVLVMPMEKSCNRLITDPAASHPGACTTARMALGVSKIKPASFGRYHDFLMSGDKEKPPALDSIIAKAYNTVDRNRLRELRNGDTLDKDIAATINLYDSLSKQHKGSKKFGLPIQIVGDYVMTGTIEKTDDIYKAWEEHLGVKPR
jgi:protein-disulfide isomerase